MQRFKRLLVAVMAVMFALFPITSAVSADFDFSALEKSIFETTLDNGLKVIILPRHDAPVVSFVTWVNVGGVDDPKGLTGLAHMFEHMAFKGTPTIGSKDYKKEKKLMAREDRAFNLLRKERLKGAKANPRIVEKLEKEMTKAIDDAYAMIEPNAFSNIMQSQGAAGFNAYTSRDQTAYIVSLPSNRVELWMALESERFLNPLLREIYREREVVSEERRMVVDNKPTGRLVEEMLAVAFKAHPYGNPLIGHMSDIQNYYRESAQKFFDKYYTPSNMTIALVGDVKPEYAVKLAKKYWGRIGKKQAPAIITTVEPKQQGERRLTLMAKAQPSMIIAWHTPEEVHPDMPALSSLASIMGQGRTSRLYLRMIRDDKVAVSASVYAGWPNTKYPSLTMAFCYPAPGKSNAQCEKIIYEEIEKLKNELITDEELEKVKARAMTGFIAGLRNNLGMAEKLAWYQQIWGDWRELFKELDRIEKVTAKDIQRVARKYLTKNNGTVACLETIVETNIEAKEGVEK